MYTVTLADQLGVPGRALVQLLHIGLDVTYGVRAACLVLVQTLGHMFTSVVTGFRDDMGWSLIRCGIINSRLNIHTKRRN